ncbi:MAG TPA: hypothetical protein VFS93_00105 [Terrimesophilobacter sp.]|nr:hypothetical protein [Terrimesophilobacter sp.]
MRAFDERFEGLSADLEECCRRQPGVTGLVLLGSAAEASRRDEWSDHDFFVVLDPEALATREDLSWLPDSERIVLVASEGEIGRAVVYEDGHLLEFAIATEAELGEVRVNRRRIVYDEHGSVARIVDRASAPRQPESGATAENHVRLFFVKILVGVGRVRRGEVLSGGRFIRTWAVDHLIAAVRMLVPGSATGAEDDLDPLRRFELDHPELGERIEASLALEPEEAALALVEIARAELEPGWPGFPTRAAEAVAARLDWNG